MGLVHTQRQEQAILKPEEHIRCKSIIHEQSKAFKFELLNTLVWHTRNSKAGRAFHKSNKSTQTFEFKSQFLKTCVKSNYIIDIFVNL